MESSLGSRHPALVWAESGLMGLSGPEHGPPALASGRWVERLDEVVNDIAALCGETLRADAAGFLGERAALVGRTRRGPVSIGGACRMVAAADGILAVSLARTSDIEAVPAWLELDRLPSAGLAGLDNHGMAGADVWAEVAAGGPTTAGRRVDQTGRLVGLGGRNCGPPSCAGRAAHVYRRRAAGIGPRVGG